MEESKMLKIGLTPCFLYPDPERKVFSKKSLIYFEKDMASYVGSAGCMPILIPDLKGEHLERFLNQLDGFIFQGGSDICPATYGEKPIDQERWPGDPYRDKFELKVLDYAYKKKKPILGICRGMQLINVFFEGTLYQDLLTETKTPQVHRSQEKYDKVKHLISLSKEGVLSSLYDGKDQVSVNSVHHQGVKKLGKNLKIEAICKGDNLAEAISHEKFEENYVLGVQWHPEFSQTLKNEVIDPNPILQNFLNKAEELRKGKK
jgi:putative glutamine amidotransferase